MVFELTLSEFLEGGCCLGLISLLFFMFCFCRGYYRGKPTLLHCSSLNLTSTTLLHHGTKMDCDYNLFPCPLGILWKILSLHLTEIGIWTSWTSKKQISVSEKCNLPLPPKPSCPWKFPFVSEASCAKDAVTKAYTADFGRQHWILVSVSWLKLRLILQSFISLVSHLSFSIQIMLQYHQVIIVAYVCTYKTG